MMTNMVYHIGQIRSYQDRSRSIPSRGERPRGSTLRTLSLEFSVTVALDAEKTYQTLG